ncbi:MAG: hypothetical protein ACJ74S_10185 [Gaiellaceae bacterium]
MVYWGPWAVAAAIFVLWLVFAWSWTVLVRLGFAISILAASTRRRERAR